MIDSPVQTVIVSPDMTSLLGPGVMPHSRTLAGRCGFIVDVQHPATLSVVTDLAEAGVCKLDTGQIILAVTRSVLGNMFHWSPNDLGARDYYLTETQATIARSLFGDRDCDGATTAFRLAKSIELLCEFLGALKGGGMVVRSSESALTRQDLDRLTAARHMIDQHWSQKLTIDQLARQCGLNRSKLTKGFRDIYRCSISEALAERRLAEARSQLLATDLPVGVIGYRSGYSNNASFTRAFGRRFGVSPTDFRGLKAA